MKRDLRKERLASRPKSLWRYLEFLPVESDAVVSLGEGMTPLVRSDNLGRVLRLGDLKFKLEFTNPTGSFKDRGTTVYVSALKARGTAAVFDDSSGNAGSSLAAYCAKANLACVIYTSSGISPQKLIQTRMYGAKVVAVKGPRIAAFDAAMRAWRDGKGAYASHMRSPFFLEGTKTIALEIAEQSGWVAPEHVVFPVGGGSLLLGAYNGFTQLRRLNWIRRIPKLHCVQAENCDPIVNAYDSNRSEVKPAKTKPTVAAGIQVADPPWGALVLAALRSTGGAAIAVRDEETLRAQRMLANQEGLFAEPTSCVPLAGLRKLLEDRVIDKEDSVVVPLTGSGLKQIEFAVGTTASTNAQ